MSAPAPPAAAPPDADQRAAALRPEASCIVQAPAGSGKTTLLVSRFVRLLAQADRPEQILAITFTRKAAAEMRLRVLAALADAGSPEGALVRARDEERGWQLADNPSRLKIQTIDSFAVSLTRQMPLASGFDRRATLLEHAEPLYFQAADRLFRRLWAGDPLAEEIARFIALTDNNVGQARRLIARMLARRDHWLDEVTGLLEAHRRSPEAVPNMLAEGLKRLTDSVSASLKDQLPAAIRRELAWLVQFAGHSGEDGAAFWRMAGRVLTTQKGEFRKQLSKNEGFAPDCQEEKQRALALIEALKELRLEEPLAALRILPAEQRSAEQIQDLMAICASLSLAVIDLSSEMREQGVADFTELTLAARRALRSGDHPTELALSLDYRIRHLLVDEFQDTSIAQFQLLELLVQGWSGESGVSLFLVGDPMQSIYRFRDADVGLFYRAERSGLDQTPLESLRLVANFRSAPELVHWFNHTFAPVMGSHAEPIAGKVPYNPSKAQAQTSGAAHLSLFETEADEILALAERIGQTLAEEPQASTALLVRSRSHLPPLLDELRRRGIPWQATDIDALADTPAVTDLLSLSAALADLEDRLAWQSLFRSPWVGLDLKDLEITAQPPAYGIAPLQALLGQLSPSGQMRMARLLDALEEWLPQLHERPPRTLLESIWIRCGGPAAYGGEEAMDQAERFFDLVDQLGADGLDPELLRQGAANLFAAASADAQLQILTIHKAKGLEFDHVLLPFLHRQTKTSEQPLLRWRLHEDRLLMAARETGSLYDWLAEEDRRREEHELQRLLYVGCTRARRTLQLTATRPEPDKAPRRSSLLHLLWPEARNLTAEASAASAGRQAQPMDAPRLLRLPEDFRWRPPAAQPLELEAGFTQAPADAQDLIASRREVALGNLIHAALCDLSQAELPEDAAPWIAAQGPLWRWRLAEAGLSAADAETCLAEAGRQIAAVLNDATGCWLLKPRPGTASEFAATGLVDGVLHSVRFDRTLEDEGIRWIVDFKTGPVAGARAIQEAVARYRPQLERYRRLAENLYAKPVKTALYLTAAPQFVEVAPE